MLIGWLLELIGDPLALLVVHASMEEREAPAVRQAVSVEQLGQPALGVAILGEDGDALVVPLTFGVPTPADVLQVRDQGAGLGVTFLAVGG